MNYNIKIPKSEIEDFIEADTETPHNIKVVNMKLKNEELIIDFILDK